MPSSSPRREVYGDVHRFEEIPGAGGRLRLHRERVLGLEDRWRGSSTPMPAATTFHASCSDSRTSTADSTTISSEWCASFRSSPIRCFGASRSRSTADETRPWTSRTSTTASRDCAGHRGARRAPRSQPDDQPRLRSGQHPRPLCELIAQELDVEPQMTLAPSLLGEVTHYVADLSKARELLGYEPAVSLDDGIARSVAWFREHRAAHPEDDVPVRRDREGALGSDQAWKTVAP